MFYSYYDLSITQLKEDAKIIHKYSEEVVDERTFFELNTREDEVNELYITAHEQLDQIRRIANILYLYTAKRDDNGVLIYVVDGLDTGDEEFRHVGDPIEEEIIPMLEQSLNDEIILGDEILDTEWGIVYVAYFPFHDYEGNVIGAIGMEFDCESLYSAIRRTQIITVVLSIVVACGFVIISYLIIGKVVKNTKAVFQDMEESVITRDNLLRAVNDAAALLLTTGEDEDIEAPLMASMELIGRSIDTDRVHIWKIEPKSDAIYFYHVYCWLSEAGRNSTPMPVNQIYHLTFGPEWEQKAMNGEVFSQSVSKMQQSARVFFEYYGVRSTVFIPLFLDEVFWGIFSIDDCASERDFTTEEITILKSVSLMMVNSINRHALIAKRTKELAMQTEKLKEAEQVMAAQYVEANKLRDAAEAASRTKSAFLANMSHEIRTPMNAILGITEILLHDNTLPENIEEGLDIIYNSCDLLLGIINGILDLSKIEAGKLDISPAVYNLSNLIQDSVQLNIMRADSKPIEFVLQVDENLPAKLIGDELRIKQVLNNLLSNAFKYTDSGKVSMSVTSEAREDEHVTALVFTITDSGHGMTEEQLEMLFSKYSRFHNNRDIHIEGTGLGLAITKELITLMIGKIEVESEPGKGTRFVVTLPQRTVGRVLLGSETAKSLENCQTRYVTHKKRAEFVRTPMTYGKILIVDDVETNIHVAVGLLKLYRLQIDTAMSGAEVIRKIEDGNKYDVILMDHMMPEMNGMEVTHRLREMMYTAPIVALTANAVAGQADMFLRNGFDYFISKPIDIRQLDAMLNKFVRDETREKTEISNGLQKSLRPGSSVFSGRSIDGLDIRKSLRRYNKDDKVLTRILRAYAASISGSLGVLESVNETNLQDYRIIVHALKGTSYDIFANQIGHDAEALESAAINGDIDYITGHNPGFVESIEKISNDIKTLLADIDAVSPKPEKDKPERDALIKLRDACQHNNMNEADAAMEEIEAYRYTSGKELVEKLRMSVDLMDFAKITEILSDLL